MKKCAILLLAIAIAIPATAQDHADVCIHIPPVAGSGSSQDDNEYITNLLVKDVTARAFTLVRHHRNADYLLKGSIAPNEMGDMGELSASHVLKVELQNTFTNIVIIEQELFYNNLDDLQKMFPYLMYDIFLQTLYKTQIDNSWQNNWFYVGANFFWTPRVYIGMDQATYFTNFGGGLAMEMQFLPFISFETGAEIASDWVTVVDGNDRYFRDLLLEIPLLVKLVIKPSRIFILEPYGGMYCNVPLANVAVPSRFSWTAGLKYSTKVPRKAKASWAGVLYIDPRFTMDFGKSHLTTDDDLDIKEYHRYIMHLGIGYKFGFVPRRK